MRYVYALLLASVGYAAFLLFPPAVSAAPVVLALSATGAVLHGRPTAGPTRQPSS